MALGRRWNFLLSASLVLGAIRCASGPSPVPGVAGVSPSAPAAGAASARWASPAEAEAAILSLEDRRAWDGEMLAALVKAPEPAIRARAAMALGRLGDDRGK